MLRIEVPQVPARSSLEGEQLALHAIEAAITDVVCVDFSGVPSMSPSFANTFIMTLCEQLRVDEMKYRVRFVNASPLVDEAMQKARERFSRGIRLSGYRPVVMPAAAR